MKAIRRVLQEDVDVMRRATDALQRYISRLSTNNEPSQERDEIIFANSNVEDEGVKNCTIKVCDILHRVFYFHGRFEENVVAIASNGNMKFRFNDGDQDILTQEELIMRKE